jgi:putative SOS response-associated peptidase YedK
VTGANALVAPLHDRMPVTLLPKSHHDWLNPDTDLMRLRQLLVPVDPSILEAYPVRRIVMLLRTIARRASSPCPTT